MKITDIELSDPIYIPFEQARHREIPIHVFSTTLPMTFLQVFTDEGITGISPTGGMTAIIENMLKP